jgi:acetyl-CoA carboxylase biotin carboxyl carrier protein
VTHSADWLDAVRRVVAVVSASDVTDLDLANGAFRVRLRRVPRSVLVAAPSAAEDTDDGQLHRVVAPFTGVFYRSPTPAARAYVREGEWVEADAVIGLLETMKIFNEVTADVSGRIVRFLVDSGQLVQAGDALVSIEPGERATADPETAQ